MKTLWLWGILASFLLLGACDDSSTENEPSVDASDTVEMGDAPDAEDGADGDAISGEERLLSVPESLRRSLPGLEAPVHVVRTEADIPHIYASNRRDLARVHGFLFAKDRFWMIDLGRRFALGRLSELVGDLVLETDITSRAQGLPDAAQRLLNALDAARRAELDAFVEGVNAYIEAVRAGELPPPSELQLVAPVLGASNPVDLMEPFSTLDILGFAALVIEQSTCALGELDRTAALLATFDAFEDAPFGELRELGLREDIFYRVEPLVPVFTVDGAVEKAERAAPTAIAPNDADRLHFPPGLLSTTADRMRHWRSFGLEVSGSNAWAVSRHHTTDGATLLAGDGHLPLAVPAYFHQAGLDTGILGGEPWHARGNFIAGLPPLGVGTNGYVAWSFTCFYNDTVDYFREELQLGDDGLPIATRFDGEWRPITRVDETYDTRAVIALGSPGGEIEQPRFETFDGRRLLSIEGRPVEEGESGVNVGDGDIVPGDIDDDGIVTGISVDATYLDVGDAIGAFYALAEAEDIHGFRDAQRRLAVFGSHFVAVDRAGNLSATGYHAAPCRDHLPRTEDGRRFALGSDPQVVMDGTRHGGFTILLDDDGLVEEWSDDPASCVVPFYAFPRALNPVDGYVVSANNDPAGLSLDSSLADDAIYIGGPWSNALRAGRIDELVSAAAAAGTADVATMAAIQADTRSATGELWAPFLVDAIDGASVLAASGGELEGADVRVADLYTAHAERFDEVAARLEAWIEADLPTPSGVETFYHQPAVDEGDLAAATMIFNAWLGHFADAVLGDERRTPGNRMTDNDTVGRTLQNLIAGRGPDNPAQLASWNPDTGESVLFDVLETPEVERSDEVALMALRDALAFLESATVGNAEGGFGTADMDQWLWGLRHTVRFESILAPFLGGELGGLGALFDRFAITTTTLPLTDEPLSRDDPRRSLVGFPRPGDNFSVDSANPGFSGTQFEYRDGPVHRMVIALYPDGRVTGQNIIPGGQSGLTDSPHFADQAALWLGNEVLPLRFHLEDVVEGAVGREVYVP